MAGSSVQHWSYWYCHSRAPQLLRVNQESQMKCSLAAGALTGATDAHPGDLDGLDTTVRIIPSDATACCIERASEKGYCHE
jgi:hypothetical protein